MSDANPYAPPPATLPNLSLVDGLKPEDVKPGQIVDEWLGNLEAALNHGHAQLPALFTDDAFWRDQCVLSWDLRTPRGAEMIKYLTGSKSGLANLKSAKDGALAPMLVQRGPFTWIQSGITFETRFGTGQGCVMLVNTAAGEWKAWIVFTQLLKLKEAGPTATTDGTANNSPEPVDHTVLIIGAGVSGLATSAHLKARNISHLIIDRNPKIGGAWQTRYDSIKLHTPKAADAMPYKPYAADAPQYRDQKFMMEWFESYASSLDLPVRLNTTVQGAKFDKAARLWRVELSTNGQKVVSTTRHIVHAAGIFGEKPTLPPFAQSPEQTAKFGGTIIHSKDYKSPAATTANVKDARVVVVGAANSAHDIAADFASAGAKAVTMVQRSAVFSVSARAMRDVQMGLFTSGQLSVAEADLMASTFPFQVLRVFSVGQTMQMAAMDADSLAKIREKGFRVKTGEDGVGFVDHQYRWGGRFYIDMGAWELIEQGRIGVEFDEDGVVGLEDKGVRLGSGKTIDADVVVLATGFQRVGHLVEELLGKDLADRAGGWKMSHMDEEGERIGVSSSESYFLLDDDVDMLPHAVWYFFVAQRF
jgi:cation diffusion facilitator CzcD-associated flavoprotein CzcO